MTFYEKLHNLWSQKKFVSVGLDPEISRLPNNFIEGDPIDAIREFTFNIIDSTGDLVAVFKPNSAFYEAYGGAGIELLRETTAYIHEKFPEVVVIDDAKRADIGNTNRGYVKAIFDEIKADAVTVHPYLGHEAVAQFLQRKDKGVFVLCRTSNPGAGELQDLEVENKKLFEVIAEKVQKEWNRNNNCALVVGATYPEEAKRIRELAPDLPFLIPGIGAQGGDLEGSVKAAKTEQSDGFIISSSRGVLYASSEDDYADAAREEVEKLNAEILKFL